MMSVYSVLLVGPGMVSLCNDECLFSLTGGPRDGQSV